MSIKEMILQAMESTKAAVTVSTATTGTGIGTILNLIPDDIGKLATLVGIILSSVLIYTHIRKGRIEYKKAELEIQILKAQHKTTMMNGNGTTSESQRPQVQ